MAVGRRVGVEIRVAVAAGCGRRVGRGVGEGINVGVAARNGVLVRVGGDVVGDASCVEGRLMRGRQPTRINAGRTSQHAARKMTFINGARVAVLILFHPFPHQVSASGEQANQ